MLLLQRLLCLSLHAHTEPFLALFGVDRRLLGSAGAGARLLAAGPRAPALLSGVRGLDPSRRRPAVRFLLDLSLACAFGVGNESRRFFAVFVFFLLAGEGGRKGAKYSVP